MTRPVGAAFVQTVRDEVGEGLRSVTAYSPDDYEILYLRADVAEAYSEAELEKAVDELRLQTVEQEYINDIYAKRHGDLQCEVDWFADAIEMNFPLDRGLGVSLAIDADLYTHQDALISQLRDEIQTHATV